MKSGAVMEVAMVKEQIKLIKRKLAVNVVMILLVLIMIIDRSSILVAVFCTGIVDTNIRNIPGREKGIFYSISNYFDWFTDLLIWSKLGTEMVVHAHHVVLTNVTIARNCVTKSKCLSWKTHSWNQKLLHNHHNNNKSKQQINRWNNGTTKQIALVLSTIQNVMKLLMQSVFYSMFLIGNHKNKFHNTLQLFVFDFLIRKFEGRRWAFENYPENIFQFQSFQNFQRNYSKKRHFRTR